MQFDRNKFPIGEKESTPKVLITGGSGFLGQKLIGSYLDRGYEVWSFDKDVPNHEVRGVTYVRGDIRDYDALTSAAKGANLLVHAAAVVPLARSIEALQSVNVLGTRAALSAALSAGITKFVFISSSAVYGIPSSNPVEESDTQNPLEPYGRAKREAERICVDFCDANSIDLSIVRPRTIIGPGRLGIFGTLYEWVAAGAGVPVLGRGENVYQFVHVDDLTEAIVRISETPGCGDFNIGGRAPECMRDALGHLCRESGTGATTFRLPKPLFTIIAKLAYLSRLSPLVPYHWLLFGESLFFSGEKAKTLLGWEPRFSSTEALVAGYASYISGIDQFDIPATSPHRAVASPGVLRFLRFPSRLIISVRRGMLRR